MPYHMLDCVQYFQTFFLVISWCCRERLRQFPSLVNCCTIDWYTPWPADALSAVATKFLAPVAASTVPSTTPATESGQPPSVDGPEGVSVADSAAAEKMTTLLADSCRSIHADAADLSTRFRREAGRITYVTPTSYLELLTMFTTLLVQRKGVVAKQQKRYSVRFSPLSQALTGLCDHPMSSSGQHCSHTAACFDSFVSSSITLRALIPDEADAARYQVPHPSLGCSTYRQWHE